MSFSSDSDSDNDSMMNETVLFNSTLTNDEFLSESQSFTTPKQLYSTSRLCNEMVQFGRSDFSHATSHGLFSCRNSNDLNAYIDPLGNMQFLPSTSTATFSIPTTSSTSFSGFPDDDSYLSQDRILQLLTSIPSLSEKIANLEHHNSNLESRYDTLESQYKELESKHVLLQDAHAELQSSFTSHCDATAKRFNSNEQYPRRNCLLINKLGWLPKYRGWRFSQFIAKQLTRLFPDYPVGLRDIDTSHVLYKDEDDQLVVVVKFVNRDVRNQIWDERSSISDPNVFLSEFFTPFNKELFSKAKAAGCAWSDKCRIFAQVNGEKKLIESEEDLSDIDPVINNTGASRPCHTPPRPRSRRPRWRRPPPQRPHYRPQPSRERPDRISAGNYFRPRSQFSYSSDHRSNSVA